MNPFIFIVARALTPILERYRDHQNYVEMILTAPRAGIERKVEQYFEKLHRKIFRWSESPLLGPGRGRWLEDDDPVTEDSYAMRRKSAATDDPGALSRSVNSPVDIV